jgi:hypothetical protein
MSRADDLHNECFDATPSGPGDKLAASLAGSTHRSPRAGIAPITTGIGLAGSAAAA